MRCIQTLFISTTFVGLALSVPALAEAPSPLAQLIIRAANPRLPACAAALRITKLRLPQGLSQSPEEDGFEVRFRRDEDFSGPSTVCLARHGDCRWIYLQFTLLVEAPIAASALQRGHVLRVEDLQTKTLARRCLRGKAPTPADLIGHALLKNVQAGDPLLPHMLKRPIVVRRGDRVRISANNPRLRAQTLGVAQASGRVGDHIPVLNASSKKRLHARVTGTGRVSCSSGHGLRGH